MPHIVSGGCGIVAGDYLVVEIETRLIFLEDGCRLLLVHFEVCSCLRMIH